MIALASLLLAACTSDSAPDVGTTSSRQLVTPADTLAQRAIDAIGGDENWSAIRFIEFDFGFRRDGESIIRRHHYWDRNTGDYRLEYAQGDTLAVVLFNTLDQKGSVFYNGEIEEDSSANQNEVDAAVHAHLNDIYWTFLPLKLFDDGVIRTVEMDEESGRGALALSFDNVGYTPDDRYLIYQDDSGLIDSWSYSLQRNPDTWQTFAWQDYKEFEDLGVRVSEAKTRTGGTTILTPVQYMGNSSPDSIFIAPTPMLMLNE